jgi:hypothetical protein
MPADTTLDADEISETVANLSDEDLAFVLFGLVSRSRGVPLVGALSHDHALMTRTVVAEVAVRWIPSEALGKASLLVSGEAPPPDLTLVLGGRDDA